MAADRLSGTIWQGRLEIDGGHEATWTLRIAQSLWAFGLAADWRVSGTETDLAGNVVLRRGEVDLGNLSGVVSWPLVAAVTPNLPIICTVQARFVAVEIAVNRSFRSGSGTMTTSDGECSSKGAALDIVPIPALHGQIAMQDDAIVALITPQTGPRVALVTAKLTAADRVVVTIHRAAAQLVPGMPRTKDSELDLPLSALLGG